MFSPLGNPASVSAWSVRPATALTVPRRRSVPYRPRRSQSAAGWAAAWRVRWSRRTSVPSPARHTTALLRWRPKPGVDHAEPRGGSSLSPEERWIRERRRSHPV